MNILPYRPRTLNRIWALVSNHYWLPCEVCGRMHGGHENTGTAWRFHPDYPPSIGYATCPKHPGRWLYLNSEWRDWNKITRKEWKTLGASWSPGGLL